ncbi:MAG: Rrf2 family transcriptional regulator [Acetobacterales bacterium]
MLLTKYADYSIRVLMYLAERPGRKVPITAIAEAYGISRNHLMKVSQNLARHGYIIGYRGKGGGIALARPARNITLGQVLEKVEVGLRPREAADDPALNDCDRSFHAALEDARRALVERLSRYTLAEIVFGGREAGPEDLPASGPQNTPLNGTNGQPER